MKHILAHLTVQLLARGAPVRSIGPVEAPALPRQAPRGRIEASRGITTP